MIKQTTRIYDADYNLLGTYDGEAPATEYIDGRNVVIDRTNDGGETARWSGFVEDGKPHWDYERLTKIDVHANPFLDPQ